MGVGGAVVGDSLLEAVGAAGAAADAVAEPRGAGGSGADALAGVVWMGRLWIDKGAQTVVGLVSLALECLRHLPVAWGQQLLQVLP